MRRFYSLRYQIMMNCWQNEPKARPSFTDLTKQLKDMENQHKVRLSSPSDIKRISVTSAECNDNNCSTINRFEVAQETGSRSFQIAFWERISTWRQIRPPKPFTMHFGNHLNPVSIYPNRKVANRAHHFL